jgi:hypothetical protein
LTLISGTEKEHSIEAIEFCNEDKFVIFAGTENYIQVLDLTTLQIRSKINLEHVRMEIYNKKYFFILSYFLGECYQNAHFHTKLLFRLHGDY